MDTLNRLDNNPAATYRPHRFIAGLDIGQLSDPSALVVLERQMRLSHGQLEPYYFAGHLERIPLQTPYPVMASGVRTRLEQLGERCALVIDATGVGRVIVDAFRAAWMGWDDVRGLRVPLANKPTIIALTLTAGEQARAESWDEQHVPRRDVLMRFMLILQQQRFQAAASLAEVPTLIKEGQAYRWRRNKAGDGDELYSDWKDAKHDDLLFAVCCAVWWGDKYAPTTIPSNGQTQYATATGTGRVRSHGQRVGGRR